MSTQNNASDSALVSNHQRVGFSLVPWKPALERHLGRRVSGLARAETVDWSFGRKRTLGIN